MRRWPGIKPVLGQHLPVNTRCSASVGTMLGHGLRRWPNIVPTFAERLVFAGLCLLGARQWAVILGDDSRPLLTLPPPRGDFSIHVTHYYWETNGSLVINKRHIHQILGQRGALIYWYKGLHLHYDIAYMYIINEQEIQHFILIFLTFNIIATRLPFKLSGRFTSDTNIK